MFPSYHSANPQLNEEASLGILKHLSKDELQQLLDNETKLSELISDNQQIRQFETEKENILTSNRSIAEYNLSQESRLQTNKRQLANTYEQAVQVQKEYDTNKEKLDYKTSQHSLDTVLALLQTEAAKSEERTETMADSFLEGNIDLENFVEEFISQRTVAHQRRVRVEKMQELMRSGVGAPAAAPAGLGQPSGGAPMGGPAPYPAPTAAWGNNYQNVAMPNAAAYLPR